MCGRLAVAGQCGTVQPPKDSPWTFTLTGRNLANRLVLQNITWGGTPNLWEGPVNPPRTIFFKIAYAH